MLAPPQLGPAERPPYGSHGGLSCGLGTEEGSYPFKGLQSLLGPYLLTWTYAFTMPARRSSSRSLRKHVPPLS